MTSNRRRLGIVVAAAFVVLAVACGGDSNEDESNAGKLIITRVDAIVSYDLERNVSTTLVTPPPGTGLQDAAVSPLDGTIAFVVRLPRQGDGSNADFSTDLWIAEPDGSNPRPVYIHAQPNQSMRFPTWLGNGDLTAVFQDATVVEGQLTLSFGLFRIDMAAGTREKLIDRAVGVDVANDGRSLLYAEISNERSFERLRTAGLDGSNAVEWPVEAAALYYYDDVDLAPDGSRVAFAAVEQTSLQAPSERYVTVAPMMPFAAPLPHGGPADIWSVDRSGKLRREVDLKEDTPSIAWSGDGEHLYILAPSGLYDLNLKNGARTKIGEGTYYAQLSWVPGDVSSAE